MALHIAALLDTCLQGAKIQYGRVPLYTRGDDASSRQFRSLHGVQRHMVDSGRCKMAYEGNEEEYEEFYDYSLGEEEGEEANGQEGTSGMLRGLLWSAYCWKMAEHTQ
jgi:hypothetical protein